MSTLANLDKTLSGQLKKPVVSTVLRVVLVLYILMLSSVDRSLLTLSENLYFQIFYFASLAYVAMVDPATAVLMAAAYLFTVQQLNRGVPAAQEAASVADVPVVTMQPAHAAIDGPDVMLPTVEPFENEEAEAEDEAADQPAFKTATENLFTSDAQFTSAQTNALSGVDQGAGVKSLTNQHSAQGSDTPMGYDPENYVAQW